jgi:hypothetical protein
MQPVPEVGILPKIASAIPLLASFWENKRKGENKHGMLNGSKWINYSANVSYLPGLFLML